MQSEDKEKTACDKDNACATDNACAENKACKESKQFDEDKENQMPTCYKGSPSRGKSHEKHEDILKQLCKTDVSRQTLGQHRDRQQTNDITAARRVNEHKTIDLESLENKIERFDINRDFQKSKNGEEAASSIGKDDEKCNANAGDMPCNEQEQYKRTEADETTQRCAEDNIYQRHDEDTKYNEYPEPDETVGTDFDEHEDSCQRFQSIGDQGNGVAESHNYLFDARKHLRRLAVCETARQSLEHYEEDLDRTVIMMNHMKNNMLVKGEEHAIQVIQSRAPNYTSVSSLPDGRLILIDHCAITKTGFLILYDPIKRTRIQQGALNLVSADHMGSDVLAVCNPSAQTIQFVRVTHAPNEKLVFESFCGFSLHLQPWYVTKLGHAEMLGLFVNGVTQEAFITIFHFYLDSTIEKYRLQHDKEGNAIFTPSPLITVDRDRRHVIQSRSWEREVVCYDLEGNHVFTYRHPDLISPSDVALDNEGNVFVCDYKSATIHKLSPDGALLCVYSDDVPHNPIAICADVSGTGFWVTQGNKDFRSKIVHLVPSEKK